MKKNPYEIFKVSKNASWSEIKSAYRKLVKIHHPDTGGDQNIMLEINAAWEILGDKDKRTLYDLSSSSPKSTKLSLEHISS